jgi:hypothetical protein
MTRLAARTLFALMLLVPLVGHAQATPGLAEEPEATGREPGHVSKKSEEELAKEAQNPVADIYSFPFQDNIGLDYGPEKGVQNVLNFQPVIPSMPGR